MESTTTKFIQEDKMKCKCEEDMKLKGIEGHVEYWKCYKCDTVATVEWE